MQPVDKSGNQTMEWMFKGHRIRVVMINDEPWWVAADVLVILELDRKALERIDEDEKGVSSIHTPGGQQNMTIINEAGLYSLILGSRKPEAKAFKRWVTHEVLPSIRKTGKYETPERREQCEVADKQLKVMELNVRTEQAKLLIDAAHRLQDRLSDLMIERLLIVSANLMAGYDAIGIPTDGPSLADLMNSGQHGRTRFPDIKPYWKPF
ncbi:BRO-N domain-containing protein [Alicyclobacillus acidocaldarius]|uniref:Prophage antirepressor n=1 Tax=Alicyclobacillus acidocaldarius (strain Tc-4-1) TaxID=1048834 RepID=F8IH46_ALIAT|nr:Bro-N domain-containing protein [Alicyclobacillus acidocaldarius]AEJ44400.1 prophage antirepressor [Alicyclobacillus acidocaldarius subsp. acidocaldarius Tc-4-1]